MREKFREHFHEERSPYCSLVMITRCAADSDIPERASIYKSPFCVSSSTALATRPRSILSNLAAPIGYLHVLLHTIMIRHLEIMAGCFALWIAESILGIRSSQIASLSITIVPKLLYSRDLTLRRWARSFIPELFYIEVSAASCANRYMEKWWEAIQCTVLGTVIGVSLLPM